MIVRGLGPALLSALRRAGYEPREAWPIGDGSLGGVFDFKLYELPDLPRDLIVAVGAGVVTLTNVSPPAMIERDRRAAMWPGDW